MATEWYYSKNGQRFGPVSGQQLKELAAKGELGPDDHVWKQGMADWLPARKVKGLLPNSSADADSFTTSTSSAGIGASAKPAVTNKTAPAPDERLPEKALRGIAGVKDRFLGLSTRIKAIAIGAVALVGVFFIGITLVCSGWLLFGGRTGSPKLVDNPIVKNDKLEPVNNPSANKPSAQEEEKLIQKADELWTSGKKHDAADIYQGILDKHGGLYHGKAASSRVYSRTIDSLVERGGPGAVQNYIKMATIARVPLVLSNPEARKLAGDAAAKEQEFLTTPPDTGGGDTGGPASAEQIARRNNAIASDLKSFTSEKDMRSTYGPPTTSHQSSIKKNAYLIAWERTRQSGQKEFLAITLLRRLDGQDQVIIVNADVVPSLDRLREMLNSKAVWNP